MDPIGPCEGPMIPRWLFSGEGLGVERSVTFIRLSINDFLAAMSDRAGTRRSDDSRYDCSTSEEWSE